MCKDMNEYFESVNIDLYKKHVIKQNSFVQQILQTYLKFNILRFHLVY